MTREEEDYSEYDLIPTDLDRVPDHVGTTQVTVAFKTKFKAMWFDEIDGQPPERSWIIKDLLPTKGFAVMYGAPKCGKSFLALDMVGACALEAQDQAQRSWFGKRVRGASIIYIAAEGQEDFKLRMKAWRQERGLEPGHSLPFVLLPTAIDMVSKLAPMNDLVAECQHWHAEMGGGRLIIVVDTVQRQMNEGGGDENTPQDMGSFIANCERLRIATDALLLAIHHSGHDASRARGHTSLTGSADIIIEVAKAEDGGANSWKVKNSKFGPEGRTQSFGITAIPLGYDEDGDNITTCIVDHLDTVAPPKRNKKDVRLTDRAKIALRALRTAIEENGQSPPAKLKLPASVASVVRYEHWREVILRTMFDPDEQMTDGAVRKAISDAGANLMAANIIARNNPYVWLIREPVI